MKKKKSNFLVHGSILAIAAILSRVIGLLYRVPMKHTITDEGMGYYGSAYTIYALGLLISSYSIPISVSKMISAKMVKKEYHNANRIFHCSLIYGMISGGVAAIAVYLYACFGMKGTMENSALALKVLAPAIFLMAILGVFRGYYQGLNTMIPTSISQIAEQILNAIVSILAAYLLVKPYVSDREGNREIIATRGAAGGTLGTLAGVVAGLLFVLFVYVLYRPTIKKQLRRDKTQYQDSYGEIFKILILTITPVILSTALYNLSTTVDVFLYNYVLTKKQYTASEANTLWGIYSNEYNTMTSVPISIANAISSAMIPSITTAIAIKDYSQAREKIKMATKFTMTVSLPCAVGMGVLASPIMRLVFRDANPIPARLLQLGAVTIIFYSLSTVSNAILQGMGKMNYPIKHSVISLVIHAIVAYILLQVFDMTIYAILISTIVFSLSMCVLNAMAIKKHLQYKQEWLKSFLLPFMCSVIMGAVAFFVYKLVFLLIPVNEVAFIVAFLAAVIVYFSLMILTQAISPTELLSFPKGQLLVKIAKKCKLIPS